MMYKHMVIYVGRSSVFTDRRFTEKLHNALHTHEAHGWELVSTAARASPLGDVSGIWLFFKRPAAYQPDQVQGQEHETEPIPPAVLDDAAA
jgi:uncharacterized iron-regulated membrane protein